MRYFQDAHTYFMHSIEKGNDVIPEQYGAAWIYTQYHVKINRKIDYDDPLLLKQWIQPYRRPLLLTLDSTIMQRGEIVARGKIETCVFDLIRQMPRRLSSIEFPDGIAEEVENDIPSFIGLGKSADGMEEIYQKIVRVSDLDKSRHMNNLRYIEMFQDAYSGDFWSKKEPGRWKSVFSLNAKREKLFLSAAGLMRPESILLRCIKMERSLLLRSSASNISYTTAFTRHQSFRLAPFSCPE